MTTLGFDPHDKALLTDPYPTYRRLRDEDPLHGERIGPSDVWVLSRFEDVARMLQDRSALTQPPGGIRRQYSGTARRHVCGAAA